LQRSSQKTNELRPHVFVDFVVDEIYRGATAQWFSTANAVRIARLEWEVRRKHDAHASVITYQGFYALVRLCEVQASKDDEA
jgi:hypothetical protein